MNFLYLFFIMFQIILSPLCFLFFTLRILIEYFDLTERTVSSSALSIYYVQKVYDRFPQQFALIILAGISLLDLPV